MKLHVWRPSFKTHCNFNYLNCRLNMFVGVPYKVLLILPLKIYTNVNGKYFVSFGQQVSEAFRYRVVESGRKLQLARYYRREKCQVSC